jgi:hypothetical protein
MSYSPICQHMLEKWGIIFWVLANSISKFIYCFEIYYSINLVAKLRMKGPRGETGVAYEVVMKMLHGLEKKGHCVIMDNCFCFISLF